MDATATMNPAVGVEGTPTGDAPQTEELQRKLRLLDKNQKAYSGDTKTALKKQMETLQALSKENEKLKGDIQTGGVKHSSVKHNIEHQNFLGTLTDDVELLERKIEHEANRCAEQDAELSAVKAQIFGARKQMGGVNVTKENTIMVEKQIRVLENRLDQALVKFNEALAYNKELREQIDNLRRERVVFDGIYKKLERELHEKKKQMADIIEKSNLYYEERDMATNELAALKAAAEKDMLQYEEHFRELEIMIEADKSLKESLKQSQKFKATLPKKEGSVLVQDVVGVVPVSPPVEEERKKKPKDQEDAKVNYEEAVLTLQEATGVHDLSLLLETFSKAPEQNFSMYNFVNDLNNEVERLEESIAELRGEYKRFRGQGIDSHRHASLKDLEEKLAKAEQTAEDFDEKTRKAQDQINELRSGIENIFTKIGGSLDDMHDMLGTTQCTESNMMAFLGIVEQRCNEALAVYNAQQYRKQRRRGGEEEEDDEEEAAAKMKFIGQGPEVPFGSTNLSLVVGQLPTTGDALGMEGFEEPDEDRILTQDELRMQTEIRLAAKEDRDHRGDGKKVKPKKRKAPQYD